MAEIPDRLNIDKDDRELYAEVEGEDVFKGRDNKDLFLFAMAMGIASGVSSPLNAKEGFVRTEYLKPEDQTLINAVAISEKRGSVDLLSQKEAVYRIAEEYAHAGIKLLADKTRSTQIGSFHKQFEKELRELCSELLADEDDEQDITS